MTAFVPANPMGNRLLSDGLFNYTYDNEGNMLTKTEIATGKVTEYAWDYRNRLTSVTLKNSGGTVLKQSQYTYDPFDKRIGVSDDPDGPGGQQPVVRWTAYDGVNPYADFDGSGNLTYRYLYGPAVDMILSRLSNSGAIAWYLTDHLGSVRDLANPSGQVIDHIKYDSFGRVLSESQPSNGDRFKYTAREFDSATGLYYYRARYYDAAVGRFLSEDPLGFQSGDNNVYRYVWNRPTIATDPAGHSGGTTDPRREVDYPEYWDHCPAVGGLSGGVPTFDTRVPPASAEPAEHWDHCPGVGGQGPCVGVPTFDTRVPPPTVDPSSAPCYALPNMTSKEVGVVSMAGDDKATRQALIELILIFRASPAPRWLLDYPQTAAMGGRCVWWKVNTMSKIIDAKAAGKLKGLNITQESKYYWGPNPLWREHHYLKIVLPNGKFFYADVKWLGGDDHIFFQLPWTLQNVPPPEHPPHVPMS